MSDDIFDGTFNVSVTYSPLNGSDCTIDAIFSRSNEPGRESGKGLTEGIRGIQANFARILIKTEQVPIKPEVHSKIKDEFDVEWDILSAEYTNAGTWRLTAKNSVSARRSR